MATCCEGGERYFAWWLHAPNVPGAAGGTVLACPCTVRGLVPVGAAVSLDGYDTAEEAEARADLECWPAGSRR